jgi:hypothetical protein
MRKWQAAAAFAAMAGMAHAGTLVDRVVATVDARAITLSELKRAELTGNLERDPGETAEHFDQRVLEELIDDYLRYRDALRFAPSPPDAAAVEAAIRKIRDRLKAEGKDPDREFQEAGLTPAEVRASVEKQLIVSAYVRDRFAALVFISSADEKAEYDRRREAGEALPPLDEVRARIREELRQRRISEQIEKWTRELREKARIGFVGLPEGAPASPAVPLSSVPPSGSPRRAAR